MAQLLRRQATRLADLSQDLERSYYTCGEGVHTSAVVNDDLSHPCVRERGHEGKCAAGDAAARFGLEDVRRIAAEVDDYAYHLGRLLFVVDAGHAELRFQHLPRSLPEELESEAKALASVAGRVEEVAEDVAGLGERLRRAAATRTVAHLDGQLQMPLSNGSLGL